MSADCSRFRTMIDGPARLQAATAVAALAISLPVVAAVGFALRPSTYESDLAAAPAPSTEMTGWAPPAQLGPSGDRPFVVQAVAERDSLDAATATSDLPLSVLAAYQRAEGVLAQAANGCHLSWSLLAAIGYVDNGNGTDGKVAYDANGVATPAVYGPTLKVSDTDAGRVDGDTTRDRAVGPMMFTPATWAVVDVDADGDGVRDPQDLDDASVAMGVLLCANRDLTDDQQLRKALWAVNPSREFRAAVLKAYAVYEAAPVALPMSGGVIAARPIAPIIAGGKGHGAAAIAAAAQHAADHDHHQGVGSGDAGPTSSPTASPTPAAAAPPAHPATHPSPTPTSSAPSATPPATPTSSPTPSDTAPATPSAPSGAASPTDSPSIAPSPTDTPTDAPTP